MVTLTEREKRLALRLPVEVFGKDAEGQGFTAQGRSLDISGQGMMIETRHHFDVGQRFELHMPLPDLLRPRFGDREIYKVVGVVRAGGGPGRRRPLPGGLPAAGRAGRAGGPQQQRLIRS